MLSQRLSFNTFLGKLYTRTKIKNGYLVIKEGHLSIV